MVTRKHRYADAMESWMKFVILFSLVVVASCALSPTLEQLEDEAITTGDWTAVERREEVVKERLETSAPGCPVGLIKKCVEEPSGIQCYCIRIARRN